MRVVALTGQLEKGSMPQAARQSAADTRQKSTARRFVKSCSVQ
ncbi:MAG: hypothetical protein JWN52_4615 [Actinomycetia bacterium]|jgi:hypothetical protein|nr:hypothetical protein [Actinomycetes bacterium]